MFSVTGFCDDTGKYSVDNPKALAGYIRQHFTGREFTLTVKAKSTRQGNQQLRYYYGVVLPDLARACGLTGDKEDLANTHEGMAWKYLRIADGPFGNPRRRSVKKDDMSQAEMSDYLTNVITWAETSIPGCRIRRPEEADMDIVYADNYDEDAA
jgi:hypothetical protein